MPTTLILVITKMSLNYNLSHITLYVKPMEEIHVSFDGKQDTVKLSFCTAKSIEITPMQTLEVL